MVAKVTGTVSRAKRLAAARRALPAATSLGSFPRRKKEHGSTARFVSLVAGRKINATRNTQHSQWIMTINREANSNKTTDPIGIRAAARALKVSPSTISRYLKNYPELDLGGEAQPMVDVDALRRHRAQHVHPAARGIKAARLLAAGGGEVTPALADLPLAAEYDKAHNAGKVLQQNLIDLAALLGEQLATMPDPREIVAMLEKEYGRILADLAASLRAPPA